MLLGGCAVLCGEDRRLAEGDRVHEACRVEGPG